MVFIECDVFPQKSVGGYSKYYIIVTIITVIVLLQSYNMGVTNVCLVYTKMTNNSQQMLKAMLK